MKDSPFTIAAKLLTEKETTPIKDGYMINKILSYQPETLLASIKLNKFSTSLPSWATTAMFNLCIPKQRGRPYLQYIKKKKEENVILLKKISQVFCCNTYHAKQITEIFRRMGKRPESFFGLKKGE